MLIHNILKGTVTKKSSLCKYCEIHYMHYTKLNKELSVRHNFAQDGYRPWCPHILDIGLVV